MSVEYLNLADRRLAYQRQTGDRSKPGILFLGGFASDMDGSKATFLSQTCSRHSISFVRFDYRGCGLSPGNFLDGTIGGWYEDAIEAFDRLTEGPTIIIGSSMGGWLGLMLAQARPQRARAFIGIAAAPDFTEDLIWDRLDEAQRAQLAAVGKISDPTAPPDHSVPITRKLIEEGRAHLILRQPLTLACPLRLLQGTNDAEVPPAYAEKIMRHVTQDDAHAILVKNGDHRLSRPQDLALLWQTVAAFLGSCP